MAINKFVSDKIWMANKFENTLNYFFNYKYNETKYYYMFNK